jgi:hypothetical protein
MDHPSTYDDDIFLWSQEQACALRALARSRSDLPNMLDLEHVAEEIEDLGRSELHRVETLLHRILEHAVKLAAAPHSDSARGWSKEIRAWQGSLMRRYTAGMRRHLDLDQIWHLAKRDAEAELTEHGDDVLALPQECPVGLEALLDKDFSVKSLVDRLLDAASTQ